MKTILQTVAVAALLLVGTQAKAEDGPIVVPSQWTHADRHAAELVQAAPASAFAGNIEEMIVLPARSTYAGQPSGGIAMAGTANAFPGSAREDPIVVPSMSTYADQFVTERELRAQGASDLALSQ